MHRPRGDGLGERDVSALGVHSLSPFSHGISGAIPHGPNRRAVGITIVLDPPSVGSDPDSDSHQPHRRIVRCSDTALHPLCFVCR